MSQLAVTRAATVAAEVRRLGGRAERLARPTPRPPERWHDWRTRWAFANWAWFGTRVVVWYEDADGLCVRGLVAAGQGGPGEPGRLVKSDPRRDPWYGPGPLKNVRGFASARRGLKAALRADPVTVTLLSGAGHAWALRAEVTVTPVGTEVRPPEAEFRLFRPAAAVAVRVTRADGDALGWAYAFCETGGANWFALADWLCETDAAARAAVDRPDCGGLVARR